jgi:hypothetical protein
MLLAERARGAGGNTLQLSADSVQLRLQAEIPALEADAAYRLRILDSQGRAVFASGALQPRQAGPYHFVEAIVAAGVLAPGGHRVLLERAAADGKAAPEFVWPLDVARH